MKENQLTVGLKFSIKDTDMSVEICSKDEMSNHLYVKITSPTAGLWFEEWNLAHTLAGFNLHHVYETL